VSGTRTRDPGRLGQLSVRVVAYRYPGEIWDLSLPSYLPLSVVAERGVAESPSRPARFRSGERWSVAERPDQTSGCEPSSRYR
jgi:hypothetical protein